MTAFVLLVEQVLGVEGGQRRSDAVQAQEVGRQAVFRRADFADFAQVVAGKIQAEVGTDLDGRVLGALAVREQAQQAIGLRERETLATGEQPGFHSTGLRPMRIGHLNEVPVFLSCISKRV